MIFSMFTVGLHSLQTIIVQEQVLKPKIYLQFLHYINHNINTWTLQQRKRDLQAVTKSYQISARWSKTGLKFNLCFVAYCHSRITSISYTYIGYHKMKFYPLHTPYLSGPKRWFFFGGGGNILHRYSFPFILVVQSDWHDMLYFIA